MSGNGRDEANDTTAELDEEFEPIERVFTCIACGFTTTREAPRLQSETQSVCANCGDWTTQLADQEVIVADGKDIAAALDGPTLTERQALASLLRDVVGLDRQSTADVIETSASNVDNLQRKAHEKLEDAQRVLDSIDAIQPKTG